VLRTKRLGINYTNDVSKGNRFIRLVIQDKAEIIMNQDINLSIGLSFGIGKYCELVKALGIRKYDVINHLR